MVEDALIVAFSGESQCEESKCDVKLVVNTGCLDDDGFEPVKRKRTRDERFIDKQNRNALKNGSSQTQRSTNQREMAPTELNVWKSYLLRKGMKSFDCGAGGNCYACVIAHFVFGDSKRHPEVRNAGIEYMKANSETFLSSFTIDDDKEGLSKIEQFHSFITDQQQVGNDIEGPMIEACLKAYGLNGVFHMIATEGGKFKGTSFCINPNVDMYDKKKPFTLITIKKMFLEKSLATIVYYNCKITSILSLCVSHLQLMVHGKHRKST